LGRRLRLAVSGNLDLNQIAPAITRQRSLSNTATHDRAEGLLCPARSINLLYPDKRLPPKRTRVFIDGIRKDRRDFES
jgi:hypothetical protein